MAEAHRSCRRSASLALADGGRSILDLVGAKLVRHVTLGHYLDARNYAGAAKFDADDEPVADVALDVCGKRLSSCKARFGATQGLNFGGFPAAALIQL